MPATRGGKPDGVLREFETGRDEPALQEAELEGEQGRDREQTGGHSRMRPAMALAARTSARRYRCRRDGKVSGIDERRDRGRGGLDDVTPVDIGKPPRHQARDVEDGGRVA